MKRFLMVFFRKEKCGNCRYYENSNNEKKCLTYSTATKIVNCEKTDWCINFDKKV